VDAAPPLDPLHPAAQAVADELERLSGPEPFEELAVADARRAPLPIDAGRALARRLGRDALPPVARVDDRTVDGPAGPLPVRVYTPPGAADPRPPLLVFVHGGGWVLGDLDGVEELARGLCVHGGCVVASVGYRKAPEARFPAPYDDVRAAAGAVRQRAAAFGADPARAAIAGESAGASLAAAAAAALPGAFRLQVLLVPVTDLAAEPGGWYARHLLADPADATDPRVSPLRAPRADLEGRPPALVVTAGADPLRGQGRAFAGRLMDARVPTTHAHVPGVMHAFLGLAAVLEPAAAAQRLIGAHVRAALA